MMNKIYILIISVMVPCLVFAQTEQILNIQLPNMVKFANLSNGSNVDSTSNELDAFVWSNGGSSSISRYYLWFDLSTLPSNAVIDSAYLSLFASPSAANGNGGSPTYGSNNAAGIYQVTNNWNISSISWSAQPSYTSTGSVILPISNTTTEDYIGTDVTTMVRNMLPGNNYGFLIKMVQETTPSNSMIFYSPLTTQAGKQPNLVIMYHMP